MRRRVLRIADGALVTWERTGNRDLIAAACPQARALGIVPGMTLAKARVLVRGLDVRPADRAGDAAWLARLGLFAARRWTPRAAVAGPDGLWLDLSGVAHLFGGEEAMCRRILAFCRRLGFTARIAVAGSAGAAHALARFGGRPLLLCPAGSEADLLAPMPLAALRLDEEALSAARRLGLERIGELLAMPRAPLQRRFGEALLTRLDQALGRAAEPFEPIVPQEPPSVLLRFLEPIASAEAIEEASGEAVRRLVPLLSEAGLGVRRLVLLCERVDNEVAAGPRQPGARDARRRASPCLAPREDRDDRAGFRHRAAAPRRHARRAAARAGDRGRAGRRPAGARSRHPGRQARRPARRAPGSPPRRGGERPARTQRPRTGAAGGAGSWGPWPRPVRLLHPPEPVEQVIAPLPDGAPARFRWRGRSYRVAGADGPERLYGEWWRHESERASVRDYFQVEDEAGARFWLFRQGDGEDPATGDLGWHMHGVFA